MLSRSKYDSLLAQYSEIIYIYTAVPSFLQTIIALLTGVLLFVYRSEYYDCKHPTDTLFGFLLGQMIFYYSFTFTYSNLLFQVIPIPHKLAVTFIIFLLYFISNTGWSLWGISVLTTTGCPSSVYAGMASFTIAYTLLFDIILLCSLIYLYTQKRKPNQTSPTQHNIPKAVDSVIIEQNSSIEDHQVAKKQEEWKEENLDDF